MLIDVVSTSQRQTSGPYPCRPYTALYSDTIHTSIKGGDLE